MKLDREILELPRAFRVREEIYSSNEFTGISYGPVDAEDRDLKDFTGMFTFDTGHFISFIMKLPEDYPNNGPEIVFSSEYLDFDPEQNDKEMGYYVKYLKDACDSSLKLKSDIVAWDSNLFVGEWLINVKKTIFKKY
tara:strand:- start:42 stop:452 length:411 start_codon:yes stop_codon:yes gene_type:complete